MDLAVDSKASTKEDMADKEAAVGDAAIVAVDASVILLLRPRFAPRMVKGKWSSSKAIMGACSHHLIHLVE